jgi:hypothetical protein
MPPCEVALREILDTQCATVEEIEDRCVACNLMYDGRIGVTRENKLYEFSDSDSPEVNRHPSTGRDIRRTLDRFFEKRIRTSRAPDYVRASLNRHNFVSVATGLNSSGLNPTIGLVSILDLAGLHKVYLFAEERGLLGFEDYEAERTVPAWKHI